MKQFARVTDVYLKHYFYEHMHLRTEDNTPKTIAVRMDYIDKFVDEPVMDLYVRKPTETWMLRRLPVKHVQPMSSVYGIAETSMLHATNNSYPRK